MDNCRNKYREIMVDLADHLKTMTWQCDNIKRTNPIDPRLTTKDGTGPFGGQSSIPSSSNDTHNFHEQYLREALNPSGVKVLFLGINPGPDGMGKKRVYFQIPFGDPQSVRRFWKIPVPISYPNRSGESVVVEEPSGRRLWKLMEKILTEDLSRNIRNDLFVQNCFVQNVCPILYTQALHQDCPHQLPPNFRERNVNPFNSSQLPHKDLRDTIKKRCDRALAQVIQLLQPKVIVAIGRDAEERAKMATKGYQGLRKDKGIVYMTHPSPATGIHKDEAWIDEAYELLLEGGVFKYMQSP